jgi:hypothetical protein
MSSERTGTAHPPAEAWGGANFTEELWESALEPALFEASAGAAAAADVSLNCDGLWLAVEGLSGNALDFKALKWALQSPASNTNFLQLNCEQYIDMDCWDAKLWSQTWNSAK